MPKGTKHFGENRRNDYVAFSRDKPRIFIGLFHVNYFAKIPHNKRLANQSEYH